LFYRETKSYWVEYDSKKTMKEKEAYYYEIRSQYNATKQEPTL